MAIFLQNFPPLIDIVSDIGSLFENLTTFATTIGLAIALAPLFFLFSLAWNYTQSFIEATGQRPKFYDPKELKRVIVVMFLIPFVPAIIGLINGIGDLCAGFFEISRDEEIANLKLIFKRVADFETISFFNFGFRSFSIVMCYFIVFLFMLVKFAVLMFTGAFQVFLIAVAPLAATMSILPFLKDQFTKLLKISINVAFVGLTLNLLDLLFYSVIIEKIVGREAFYANDFLMAFLMAGVCFVILIFYLLAIWLTSQYAGDPAAAAIMSMATTVAAAGAMLAVNAMGGMAGSTASAAGGGSGGSNLGGDIAKDIAKGLTDDKDKK